MVEAAGTPILHSVSTPLPGSVATLLSNRGVECESGFRVSFFRCFGNWMFANQSR